MTPELEKKVWSLYVVQENGERIACFRDEYGETYRFYLTVLLDDLIRSGVSSNDLRKMADQIDQIYERNKK